MARTNATNFTGGLQFPYATAATDLFKKEDVQVLAQAVDQHDHSVGKGLILGANAIPAGFITSAMIADGTITGSDIAAATISGGNIIAGTIVSGHIADGSIQGGDIAAGTIQSSNILDGTIATADLAIGAATQTVYGPPSPPGGNFSTSSTTPVDIPGMTVTLTTSAGPLVFWACGPGHMTGSAGVYASIALNVDGSDVSGYALIQTTVNATPWAFAGITFLTAASHTLKLRVACPAGGTVTMNFTGSATGIFICTEFKR